MSKSNPDAKKLQVSCRISDPGPVHAHLWTLALTLDSAVAFFHFEAKNGRAHIVTLLLLAPVKRNGQVT